MVNLACSFAHSLRTARFHLCRPSPLPSHPPGFTPTDPRPRPASPAMTEAPGTLETISGSTMAHQAKPLQQSNGYPTHPWLLHTPLPPLPKIRGLLRDYWWVALTFPMTKVSRQLTHITVSHIVVSVSFVFLFVGNNQLDGKTNKNQRQKNMRISNSIHFTFKNTSSSVFFWASRLSIFLLKSLWCHPET